MGYQITFKPSEEKMKEYKPWNEEESLKRNYDDEVDLHKREIIDYCMSDHNDDSASGVAKSLLYQVKFLQKTIEQLEKESAYNRWKADDNKELWYCGWNYARDCDFEKDDFIRSSVDKLCILAKIVKTPDYFDEGEKFFKKLNDIEEEIDGMIDIFQDIAIHEIINDLNEFNINDDNKLDKLEVK